MERVKNFNVITAFHTAFGMVYDEEVTPLGELLVEEVRKDDRRSRFRRIVDWLPFSGYQSPLMRAMSRRVKIAERIVEERWLKGV